MALKNVSVQDVSIILENLSFLTLVEPFRSNGMSGKSISRFESYKDIIELDSAGIKKAVAQTFFEDFVVEWKSTGMIPKDLLQPSVTGSSNMKVCIQ